MNNGTTWQRIAGTALLVAASTCSTAAAQKEDATFKVVCVADPKAPEVVKRKGCLNRTPLLSFGDEVTLAVEHAPETDFDGEGEPNPADLVLFLEGRALPGTRAQVGRSEMDNDGVTTTLLTYRIARDLSGSVGRKNWKEALVAAQNRPLLAASTGLENGSPAPTEAVVEFVAVTSKRLTGWVISAIVFAILFFLAAVRTGALRDQEPPGAIPLQPTQRAYSLARVQMAGWTILFVLAYGFVWMLTGEYKGTIPGSMVVLMGITLSTLGAAAAVDAGKVQTNKEKLQEVKAKLAAGGGGAAPATLQSEEQALEGRTQVCKTEGCVRDLLTSADGASLHRLQFTVWTLVLMVVFIVTVWKTLAMPEFDDTLLALMGITSGAYVGLKLPEAKT